MPAAVVKVLAKKAGTSKDRAERLWKKAKKAAEEQGRKDDYQYVTGIFKKMLKLEVAEWCHADSWLVERQEILESYLSARDSGHEGSGVGASGRPG